MSPAAGVEFKLRAAAEQSKACFSALNWQDRLKTRQRHSFDRWVNKICLRCCYVFEQLSQFCANTSRKSNDPAVAKVKLKSVLAEIGDHGMENKDGICCEECRYIPSISRVKSGTKVFPDRAAEEQRCELAAQLHAHLLSTCKTPAGQFQGTLF